MPVRRCDEELVEYVFDNCLLPAAENYSNRRTRDFLDKNQPNKIMATKSRGYLQLHETVELTLRGIVVWAYTKRGKYLGRVELNRAGLSVSTDKKGTKRLGNMSWEQLFERLDKDR